jgi:hypothetical protein
MLEDVCQFLEFAGSEEGAVTECRKKIKRGTTHL